jgi:hypothetical protein
MSESETPLDRIFVEDADERPDEIVLDGMVTVDTEEFRDQLETLADAAEAVNEMANDLASLRSVGLTDGDVRDLLYGRNNSLRKRDITAGLEAIDELAEGRADRPFQRLLSEVSGLNLSETKEVIDELERLQRKYGED